MKVTTNTNASRHPLPMTKWIIERRQRPQRESIPTRTIKCRESVGQLRKESGNVEQSFSTVSRIIAGAVRSYWALVQLNAIRQIERRWWMANGWRAYDGRQLLREMYLVFCVGVESQWCTRINQEFQNIFLFGEIIKNYKTKKLLYAMRLDGAESWLVLNDKNMYYLPVCRGPSCMCLHAHCA